MQNDHPVHTGRELQRGSRAPQGYPSRPLFPFHQRGPQRRGARRRQGLAHTGRLRLLTRRLWLPRANGGSPLVARDSPRTIIGYLLVAPGRSQTPSPPPTHKAHTARLAARFTYSAWPRVAHQLTPRGGRNHGHMRVKSSRIRASCSYSNSARGRNVSASWHSTAALTRHSGRR